MAVPTYAQLSNPLSSGAGLVPQETEDRLLSIVSILASGQNPDGSAAGGVGVIQGQPGSIFTSGRWFPQLVGTGTALLITINVGYAYPIIIGNPHTFTDIGVNATVAGTGGNLRFGLYADNGSGYPGALIDDFGVISAASTGQISISGSNALASGLYWCVTAGQGGSVQPTLNTPSASSTTTAQIFGSSAAGIATTAVGWSITGLSGAMPNPFTTGGTLAAASSDVFTQMKAS